MEHDGLNACMNILAFCATEDELASRYLSIAIVFQNALSTLPITSDLEAVDPSPHYCHCSASSGPFPPALANTPTSQTSISTSAYHDTDGALVRAFDAMQDLSVDSKYLYLNTSN
jgi:hypothetical protein